MFCSGGFRNTTFRIDMRYLPQPATNCWQLRLRRKMAKRTASIGHIPYPAGLEPAIFESEIERFVC